MGALNSRLAPVEVSGETFYRGLSLNDRAPSSTVDFGNDSVGIEQERKPIDQVPTTSTPNRDAEEVSMFSRTSAVVRGLQIVLGHHDAPKAVLHALDHQLHEFLDTQESEMVWLKCTKYILTYPLAKYLRNELPPQPPSVFCPKGCLRAWMRVRLNSFNRRNTHLWYSWLQAKRAALPLSEDVIERTYQDHFQTLSSEDQGDESVIKEIFEDETFKTVLDQVRKGLMANLEAGRDYLELSPSSHACFENTRANGGQHGELLSIAGEDRLEASFHHDELVSMQLFPCVYSKTPQYNVVREVRRPQSNGDWAQIDHCIRDYLDEAPRETDCTIQAILEPFKVRVISKGEALPYYSVKPLQVAMHSAMRHMDCFRLIGRPFYPTDLFDLAEKSDVRDEWFSVDYSAATDGLSWKYSGKIFKYLIGNLPREQYRLAMAVLGPHRLHYPKQGSRREVVFRGLQRNGQLMGSTLSFPILCLANLGVYLLTTQAHQQGWSHEERLRHVLINGDDMLYRAPRSLWEDHIRVGKAVGLNMSVGKAYHHHTYANVNSISVHYSMADGVTPWQIDFLNTGLIVDQHKVMGQTDNASGKARSTLLIDQNLEDEEYKKYSCATNLNVILRGCLPGKQARVAAQFLKLHKEKIELETRAKIRLPARIAWRHRVPKVQFISRNIFIPIDLGGLGVDPPVGFKFRITRVQRMLAAMKLSQCCAPHLLGSGPVPGYHLLSETQRLPAWFKPGSDIAMPSWRVGERLLSRRLCELGVQFYAPNPSTYV
jgi:hypothetical protein